MAEQQTTVVTEASCSHHWVIESPNGATSIGECKLCGETREFKNSIRVTSWESEGSHLHRTQGLVAS